MTVISELTPSPPSDKKPKRTKKGTFPAGQSGNPAGRPLGAKNKITLLRQALELDLREQAQPHMRLVLAKAIELALDGDRAMIKLLLEQHMSKAPAEELGAAAERPHINITGVSKVEVSAPSPASSEVAIETPSSLGSELTTGN